MLVEITPRERAIGELILQACPNSEIAILLNCSLLTVDRHLSGLHQKFRQRDSGVHFQRVQLALFLYKHRAELGMRCQA